METVFFSSSFATLAGLFAQSKSSGGSAISFLILPLMIAAMYFFMIRPQQKRQKEQASFNQSLVVGASVVTSSGIYGTVTALEDDAVHLEIDKDIVIKIARSAIVRSQDDAPTPQRGAKTADKNPTSESDAGNGSTDAE